MAKRTKVMKYVLLLFVALLGISCMRSNKEYSNIEMIGLAETYKKLFDDQYILQIESHSDHAYYICTYRDTSIYIVTYDSKVIRGTGYNRTIISSNAKDDPNLPIRFQELLSVVQSIYSHEIRYVSVKSDSIRLERFDGYYLSNIKPYDCSAFEVVQNKWYIRPKDK